MTGPELDALCALLAGRQAQALRLIAERPGIDSATIERLTGSRGGRQLVRAVNLHLRSEGWEIRGVQHHGYSLVRLGEVATWTPKGADDDHQSEVLEEQAAMADLDDVGVVAFARARDAGATILGARVDAQAAQRAGARR